MRPTLALLAVLAVAAPAFSQDLFSPLIVVGDRVVTGYELDQRVRMLTFFNTSGDVAAVAREQLVEDRLKQQEMDRVGLEITPEAVEAAIADFATRVNLDGPAFVQLLGQNGVAAETLRDYVGTNAAWRDYVRARFGDRVTVTEAEVDQRIAQEAVGAAGVEVLLSEIVIPAPPERAGQAGALALELSRIIGEDAFSAAAREYSATPTREAGGRLDWTPLTNYPGGLQEVLLALAPGEVTAPIPLEGAVALLQLRAVREAPVAPPAPAEIDYAVLAVPGPDGLAEAARIAAGVDACDDLFGVAQATPERLTRQRVAPGAVPQDVALALAGLDANEATVAAPAADGSVRLVMLCARSYPLPEGAADRAAVETAIRNERLAGYANAVVADLRAAATIVGE